MKTSKVINGIKYQYRLVTKSDIDMVMPVIESGRETLKAQGNGQWQDGYPSRFDLLNDIKNKNLYVIYNNKKFVGVLALIIGDNDYSNLIRGKWLSNGEFLVMHRCAILKEYQGIGLGYYLFDIFKEVGLNKNIHSLRIDTHEYNNPMRHLIERNGFTYCGNVILTGNKERVVYEKLI